MKQSSKIILLLSCLIMAMIWSCSNQEQKRVSIINNDNYKGLDQRDLDSIQSFVDVCDQSNNCFAGLIYTTSFWHYRIDSKQVKIRQVHKENLKKDITSHVADLFIREGKKGCAFGVSAYRKFKTAIDSFYVHKYEAYVSDEQKTNLAIVKDAYEKHNALWDIVFTQSQSPNSLTSSFDTVRSQKDLEHVDNVVRRLRSLVKCSKYCNSERKKVVIKEAIKENHKVFITDLIEKYKDSAKPDSLVFGHIQDEIAKYNYNDGTNLTSLILTVHDGLKKEQEAEEARLKASQDSIAKLNPIENNNSYDDYE